MFGRFKADDGVPEMNSKLNTSNTVESAQVELRLVESLLAVIQKHLSVIVNASCHGNAWDLCRHGRPEWDWSIRAKNGLAAESAVEVHPVQLVTSDMVVVIAEFVLHE